jgi:hypothetical protein
VHSPGWLPLLVGFDGHADIVEREMDVVARTLDRLGAQALAGVGDAWLEHRFDPPAFLRAGEQPGRLGDAIDVTAWWSSVEILDRVRTALDPQHVLNPDRLGGGSVGILRLAMHAEGETE